MPESTDTALAFMDRMVLGLALIDWVELLVPESLEILNFALSLHIFLSLMKSFLFLFIRWYKFFTFTYFTLNFFYC